MGQAGFHGVNAVTADKLEQTNEAIVNKATAAAKDKEAITSLQQIISSQKTTIKQLTRGLRDLTVKVNALLNTCVHQPTLERLCRNRRSVTSWVRNNGAKMGSTSIIKADTVDCMGIWSRMTIPPRHATQEDLNWATFKRLQEKTRWEGVTGASPTNDLGGGWPRR